MGMMMMLRIRKGRNGTKDQKEVGGQALHLYR